MQNKIKWKNKGKLPSRALRSFALVLVVASFFWSFSAPALTATERIESITELMSYFIAGFFAVCGVILYTWCSAGLPKHKLILSALGSAGVVSAITCACCFSDAEFVFWKMRTTSTATWEQMASDLRSFGKQVTAQDSTGLGNFHHLKTPQSFQHLGLEKDFAGGNAGRGVNPYVWFGATKGRRWGIVIGSNYFSHGNWTLSKRIEVATNVYFFAGPNY